MNDIQTSRYARKADPDDRRRRLRRWTSRIASVLGKRIGTGAISDLATLAAKAQAQCADELERNPRAQFLVRAVHDIHPDAKADLATLIAADVIRDVQRYGEEIKGWRGFRVDDPRTWPRRRA